MAVAVAFLLFLVGTQAQLAWDQVPLNQFPFIMAHDAATGYLDNDPAYWWVKTQSTGFGGQANCGARAFDVRPQFQQDGNIVMHHGDVTVPKKMTDALQELVTFANQNPNELIIVYISHCDGDGCMEATEKAVRGIGVPTCTDGNQLYNATYGSTKALGHLPPGGAMLVIFGDVNENYDDSITCYGGSLKVGRSSSNSSRHTTNATVVVAAERTLGAEGDASTSIPPLPPSPDFYWYCYGDNNDQESAFEPLWQYLRLHSAEDPPASGQIQMLQAHWQYDAAAIAQGVLHASSILDDESRASVNSKVADAVLCAPCPVSGGVFKYHNLIEVNNVCDASPKLFNAFRSRVPPNPPSRKESGGLASEPSVIY